MSVKKVIKDNYNMMLLKDYLRERIREAGFAHVDMAKTPTGTRVSLHVTRPGIVIGRKGAGIKEITDVLGTRFGLKNPQISVVEIEKPEMSPGVMCNRIATHISRGIAFRRATMWTLRQIMEGGAMGVQITVSGKLRGDRSAFEKHTQGILPRAGHHAEMVVSEDVAHVQTPMGLIGVRIRIARKERIVPEFEMRAEDKAAAGGAGKKKGGGVGAAKARAGTKKEGAAGGKDAAEAEAEEAVAAAAKTGGDGAVPETESEHIVQEEEKMKSLETLEEEENKLK